MVNLSGVVDQYKGPELSRADQRQEWLNCKLSPLYFVLQYVWIYNATDKEWMRFDLWLPQRVTLARLHEHQYFILLKARQLGMSWLCLAYALWMMVFEPGSTILLFSKRHDEAKELLAERLMKMYDRLPPFLQTERVVRSSSVHFELSNGSRALSFPTSGGRSYTATMVILDEADFIEDLAAVLNAIKPTVDAGGKLAMISTIDKERPLSPFKNIFRAAYYRHANQYQPLFFSWRARPERTEEWYEGVKADMFEQTGSNDGLYQEYPATVEEALAPLELNKRLPFVWIDECSEILDMGWTVEDLPHGAPEAPNMRVYREPVPHGSYIISADTSEGVPGGDDATSVVLDAGTWEEVACFFGKMTPEIHARWIERVSLYYNHAPLMSERNNHGHAVMLAIETTQREEGPVEILSGHDDKPGWLSNSKGKVLMYDLAAETFRDQGTLMHTGETTVQLKTIELNTLRAPEGLPDDLADGYCLALVGLRYGRFGPAVSGVVEASDPLADIDDEDW